MIGENVVYAGWPQLFRVRIFKIENRGGFSDAGMFPLETPKVGNNTGWGWLLNQLVEMGVITEAQAAGVSVDVYNGRSMSLEYLNTGKKFMLLMPV